MAPERRKSIFRRWWFWLIIIIILIIIAVNSCGGSDDTTTDTEDTTTKSTETQKSANEDTTTDTANSNDDNKTTQNADDDTITKEEFDKVKSGMTYDEVVNIVGSKGQVLSESGEEGSDYYTVIYEWKGDKGWGANANMTFQGGKLLNKSQIGVSSGDDDVTITLDEFNKIKNGMSYDEVKKIIGGEGTLNSESGEKGSEYYTAMYSYEGTSAGANAIFTFQGDKLQNKTQMGLK